ncbi:Zn(II)2Cys6 transcription factor domain-containing protein [Aspergillus ibericus CBS 121593]|uniref:Zn(2)-C6 fungal-type domain-containing protein n=1 Tax=Aspergillus ibericus CBS 121593 TaxID=1448316 RepID=A0A395HCJ7_9EURO|nr:hypothetical protein BO80DRAFT_373144 [Aspergillus ibericus CBS 121593]RAL04875.1 hypothetical protein BO80DRAFT_373144 [Aspergillus ibericus CBS 121593]
MPLARRSHRKVRTGCSNCKRRRIKCDETKPSCIKCLQHRISCTYHPVKVSGRNRTSNVAESSPDCSQPGDHEADTAASLSRSKCLIKKPHWSNGSGVNTIEIIHHYTYSTYKTLAVKDEVQRLWQVIIPEIAFHNGFLLRVICAISALHMWREKLRETRYLTYAHEQYAAAVEESATALTRISKSNCSALYAFSALAFIFELGTSYNRPSVLYNQDGTLAHWIVHIRGVRAIIACFWHDLSSGALRLLLQRQDHVDGPRGLAASLNALADQIRRSTVTMNSVHTLLQAVSKLLSWSKMGESAFFGWLSHCDNEFATLLGGRDPFALVIFAHACVLLKSSQPAYWIGTWPEKMIQEIYGSLDSSWRSCLHWPMDGLGLCTDGQD